MPNPPYRQHVIFTSGLSTEQLELSLQTTLKLKEHPRNDLLEGKLIGSCFSGPSTHTRLSFETTVQRLDGKVIDFSDGVNTSAKKGETLADTVHTIPSYTDAITQCHPKDGVARVFAEFSKAPTINVGDGTNQHLSQTLLDLITIYETQDRLNNLKVAMAGNFKYDHTVHSPCQALKRWDCEFAFVSPSSLAMPKYTTEELEAAGCRYQILPDPKTAVEWMDTLYMIHVQCERFDGQGFAEIQGKFNLNAAMFANARLNPRVLHPLPRADETHPDIDVTPHAYYFEQATNGVYARMVILSPVLDEEVQGANMENKKFSVEAIENGTIIDHIPAGLGLTTLRQLKLLHYGSAVTVDFNLPSKAQSSKDTIEISGVAFDDAAANRLALFALEATVSTTADLKVVDKRHLILPDKIAEVFRCPNANCASHGEPVKSRFYAKMQNGQTRLKCHYYEKAYSRDSVVEV